MNQIQAEDLRELGKRLVSDTPLLVGDFNFKYIYSSEMGCGCAVGERLLMKGKSTYCVGTEWAYAFYGINIRETLWLFAVPERETVAPWNTEPLTWDSTRTEMGEAILRFVDWKEKQGEIDPEPMPVA